MHLASFWFLGGKMTRRGCKDMANLLVSNAFLTSGQWHWCSTAHCVSILVERCLGNEEMGFRFRYFVLLICKRRYFFRTKTAVRSRPVRHCLSVSATHQCCSDGLRKDCLAAAAAAAAVATWRRCRRLSRQLLNRCCHGRRKDLRAKSVATRLRGFITASTRARAARYVYH